MHPPTPTSTLFPYTTLFRSAVSSRRADLLFGTSSGAPVLSVFDLPDHAQICNCNGVSKGAIKEAIQIGKCSSVSRVGARSEEHTSELQSHSDLVCRLLLEKK